jgi:serine/threonine protein kinase
MKFTYATDAKPVEGYTIRRGIHRGGYGEVYYAVSDAGKEVALKLLTHDLDTELRGIRQCLNLKHPNLVSLFDVRTDADGEQWVVMEYVHGSNLEDVLATFPQGLPISEVSAWLEGLVNGVEFLHDRGLVHRDLKPANIYRENGVVKVGDVGLSKRLDGARGQHTESIGTVYYMAPEITHGQYGPQVDVYSLGIMLYEMLTGKLPFNGETSGEILMKQLSAAPDLSAVTPHLRAVVARALEKDPKKRTPTARQLWVEFEGALSPTAIPESHFVNGKQPAAAKPAHKHDTDHNSLKRTPVAVHAAPPRTTPSTVPPASGSAKKSHGLLLAGMIGVLIWISFVPWHQMSWGDRAESAKLIGFFGGVVLFLLWAREHWRPDAMRVASPGAAIPQPGSLSDWSGRMAVGALAGGVLSVVAAIAPWPWARDRLPMLDTQAMVYSAAVVIFGTWIVIACRRLREAFAWADEHPRWLHALAGVAIGTAAFGLDQFLLHDFTRASGDLTAEFNSIGVAPLAISQQPTWLGYVVFFSGTMLIMSKQFLTMQRPHREHRWAFWPVVWSGGVAWFWTLFFTFPETTGMLWMASIAAAVQLATPWQPPLTSRLARR